MLRIAICDDVKEMVGILRGVVEEEAEKLSEPYEIQGFTQGSTLVEIHEKKPFQLIFLDISMPGMSGFEAAQKLNFDCGYPCLVFVTSKEELVFESFDYRPFHFVRKRDVECMRRDVIRALEKMKEYRREEREFVLQLPYNRKRSIRCKDILYLLSDGNYMIYVLKNGENIKVRGTMRDAQLMLEEYYFVRIHKRILVNMSCIQTIDTVKNEIYGGQTGYLEIGRNYKRSVLEKYFDYTRSRL